MDDSRWGLGDASLYPSLLEALGVEAEWRERILGELVAGDFVGVESELRTLGLADADVELMLRVAQTRGGPDVLTYLGYTSRKLGRYDQAEGYYQAALTIEGYSQDDIAEVGFAGDADLSADKPAYLGVEMDGAGFELGNACSETCQG